MTINSKTSLTAIKNAIRDDFNVEITNAQAKEIRESRKQNTSTWTPAHYRNVANSARIREINENSVRYGSAVYTTAEWNKAVRAGDFS